MSRRTIDSSTNTVSSFGISGPKSACVKKTMFSVSSAGYKGILRGVIWILKKIVSGKKAEAVVLLCFFCFLLVVAWFMLSSLASAIHNSIFSSSEPPIDSQFGTDQVAETAPTSAFYPESSRNHLMPDTEQIVENVLQSRKFLDLISSYQRTIKDLENEINGLKLVYRERIENLSKIIFEIRSENSPYQNLTLCSNTFEINQEVHIMQILQTLFSNPEFLLNQKGLSRWLRTFLITKQDLENHTLTHTQTLKNEYDKLIKNTTTKVLNEILTHLNNQSYSAIITDNQIKKVVDNALKILIADKTGLTDFAMESMGGEIITTRNTESYPVAVISFLGISLWPLTRSPRIVILPEINPGECWAFRNFPGVIVVKLARRIKVDGISVEHVSKLLIPDGKIDSAPKDIEVYGLNHVDEENPLKLGRFVYDYDGDSSQFFAAQKRESFSMVEVRIETNHGHPNYTCLYRIRVHGSVSRD